MARVANTATNVYSVAGSIYPVTRYRSLALSTSTAQCTGMRK